MILCLEKLGIGSATRGRTISLMPVFLDQRELFVDHCSSKGIFATVELPQHEKYMQLAIEQARLSLKKREFPVGAVLVRNDEVIGASFNQDKKLGYLAHAEMLLLLDIDKKRPKFSERKEMTLYTTLEPCLMCMGAAISFFVGKIVYSLDAPEDGGVRLQNIQFGGPSIQEYKMPILQKSILVEQTKELIREYISIGENRALVEYAKNLLK